MTKQANKHPDIIKHPDNYTARRVSPETAKNLKRAGYQVNNGKALIYSKNQRVTITKGKITFRSISGMRAQVLLQSRPDFLRQLEKLRRTEREYGGHVPGRTYTFKIGDSPRFHVSFRSLEDALFYARDKDQEGWNNEDARDHISLVILDEDTGDDH